MSVDFFLDTDLLIYAHDAADAAQRSTAQSLITRGLQNGDTAISAV